MRIRVACIILGLLLVGSVVVSCAGHSGRRHVICDFALDSGTFEGRLVTRTGPGVTFMVERVHPNVAAVRTGSRVPVAGRQVVVHYDAGNEQLLRVGRRYKVKVWWLGDAQSRLRFVSGVHVANRPCSGGTVYADGSAIET